MRDIKTEKSFIASLMKWVPGFPNLVPGFLKRGPGFLGNPFRKQGTPLGNKPSTPFFNKNRYSIRKTDYSFLEIGILGSTLRKLVTPFGKAGTHLGRPAMINFSGFWQFLADN